MPNRVVASWPIQPFIGTLQSPTIHSSSSSSSAEKLQLPECAHMGIHVVALAKLNHLIFAGSRSSSPAAVSCLVWPFLVRLATSCGRVWRGYPDAVYASRLFLFQLRLIVLPPGGGGRDRAAGTRWERALRLVCRRLIGGWQSTAVLVDEDSFHTLSILAL